MFLKTLTIFLLMSTSSGSNLWEKSLDAGQTTVWKNSLYPKTYLSITKSKGENSLAHEIISEDMARIQYKKQALLKLVGVSNWKVRNFNWNAKTRTLNSYGIYTDHNGIEVIFKEKQVFKKGSTKQYLITTNKKNSKVDLNAAFLDFIKNESKK